MKFILFLIMITLSPSCASDNSRIVVVIADSGVYPHKMIKNLKNDGSVNYTDEVGHGTMMAGLIALGANLDDPLCDNVELHSCKLEFPNKAGFGGCLNYARLLGADYVNVSGGGPGVIPEELEAFSKFKGITFAAAGNNGVKLTDSIKYFPASYSYAHGLTNIKIVQAVCENCRYSNTHESAISEHGGYVYSTDNKGGLSAARGSSQATAIALHKELKQVCSTIKGVRYDR